MTCNRAHHLTISEQISPLCNPSYICSDNMTEHESQLSSLFPTTYIIPTQRWLTVVTNTTICPALSCSAAALVLCCQVNLFGDSQPACKPLTFNSSVIVLVGHYFELHGMQGQATDTKSCLILVPIGQNHNCMMSDQILTLFENFLMHQDTLSLHLKKLLRALCNITSMLLLYLINHITGEDDYKSDDEGHESNSTVFTTSSSGVCSDCNSIQDSGQSVLTLN